MIAIEYVRNLPYCREIIICIEKIVASLPPLHYHLGRGLIKRITLALSPRSFIPTMTAKNKDAFISRAGRIEVSPVLIQSDI